MLVRLLQIQIANILKIGEKISSISIQFAFRGRKFRNLKLYTLLSIFKRFEDFYTRKNRRIERFWNYWKIAYNWVKMNKGTRRFFRLSRMSIRDSWWLVISEARVNRTMIFAWSCYDSWMFILTNFTAISTNNGGVGILLEKFQYKIETTILSRQSQ